MIFDPLALNPERNYCYEKDEMVREIMLKLEVPDLLQSAPHNPYSVMSCVGFENHPTHWICFTLWQGNPNHADHKAHKGNPANKLNFDAYSKKSTPRAEFLEYLHARMGANSPTPELSQFPIFE